MVLSIFKLSLVLVRFGLEAPVSLKFSMEEVAVEFVSGIENDLALAMLQVIYKAALVDVQTSLLKSSLSLVFLALELSLVGLILVSRSVLPPDQFVVFKVSLIDSALLRKYSFSEGVVVEPWALISRSIIPRELAVAVLFIIGKLPLVKFVIIVLYPHLPIGELLYFGEAVVLLWGEGQWFFSGSGQTDEFSIALGGRLFWEVLLLEGIAFFAHWVAAHLNNNKLYRKLTKKHFKPFPTSDCQVFL